jgi:hypothetical protein
MCLDKHLLELFGMTSKTKFIEMEFLNDIEHVPKWVYFCSCLHWHGYNKLEVSVFLNDSCISLPRWYAGWERNTSTFNMMKSCLRYARRYIVNQNWRNGTVKYVIKTAKIIEFIYVDTYCSANGVIERPLKKNNDSSSQGGAIQIVQH